MESAALLMAAKQAERPGRRVCRRSSSPPPILGEVQTVFDPPVVPHVPQEVRGRDAVGVEAGDEVADVVRRRFAGARSDLAIDADR